MKATFLIAFVLIGTSTVHAESNIELQKKNAFLTLSAFECAVVSPNEKETERLFTLGLKVGRDFIQFAQANTDLYLKTIKPQVPMLWNWIAGPSPDFILGQIYADREHDVYKEFSLDNELWKIKKQNMYNAKNCVFLSEK
jgi:hypothetical protein